MKKILFALALLAFSFTGVYAQTDSTVVEPTRDSVTLTVNDDSGFLVNVLTGILDASKKTSRQEKKRSYRYTGWHVEPYIGLGFVAGPLENSTAKINYGESYSVDFGLKSRYQFTGIYSLTFNVGFMHNRYKITDGMINGITAPVNISNNFVTNNERFRTWAFGLSFGQRFNFCKTRRLKNYVEASVYGNYVYSRKYITDYKGDNDASATLDYNNPNIFSPFEAGAQLNLGFHWFSVWGRYRLTDWFDSDYTAVKIPRLTIGMAVNFGD